MKAHTIVGYTFQAENICPPCARKVVGAHYSVAPLDDSTTEEFFRVMANTLGIDYEDERSYDSGDFPKVIFAIMAVNADECGRCGAHLLE